MRNRKTIVGAIMDQAVTRDAKAKRLQADDRTPAVKPREPDAALVVRLDVAFKFRLPVGESADCASGIQNAVDHALDGGLLQNAISDMLEYGDYAGAEIIEAWIAEDIAVVDPEEKSS